MNLEDQGIYVHFNEENMLEANAIIIGPKDTPYENGILYFVISRVIIPKAEFLISSRKLYLDENIDKTKGEAYNIGSGEVYSIDELLKLLLKTMDSNLEIEYVEKDFPEISHQYLDSSKIKNHIGWTAKTNLTDGLQKSIRKYKDVL